MSSSPHDYPESRYLSSSFHFHRAMAATAVAAICGVIGGAVGVFSLISGQPFDFQRAQAKLNAEYAQELAYDFMALKRAETDGAAGPTGAAAVAPAPGAANAAASPATADDEKRCTEGTWPFVSDNCLWGAAGPEWHRRRIVSRLKGPWCSGLRDAEGAYNCRSRR